MKRTLTLISFLFLLNARITAQEICPAENISVLGGDGQNIVMWDEPLNPFTVLLTIEVVTDTWQGETSWDLVSMDTGELVASIAQGDLTEANTSYTWDFDIPHGTYSFTIYDSFGDGIYSPGGYALSLDGVSIYSNLGEGWTGTEETIEFNTTEGRFTATNNSYVDPIPFDKDTNYDLGWLAGMELTGPILVISGSFSTSREVPEECGAFTHYAVYSGDGTEIGTTTELEYAHEGLTNGTEYCYYVTVVYEEGTSDPTEQACGTPSEWVAEAPSNLMSFPGDEEMVLVWMAPGGGGGGTQGDVIDNPFVVTGIPFEANGTTEGFNDDYDEVCPYTGSTSNDVVYMFSTSGGTYDFSLCESGYDTKLYIYDINQVNIACNDDACNNAAGDPWRSLLESVTLDPGLYYVIVDGYGGNNGEYQLLIDFSGNRSYDYDTTEKDSDDGVSDNRTEYDFLGYNIYVDDAVVNTDVVEFSTYTVTGLSNEETYTFGVTAVYEGDPNYESEMITVTDGPVYLFGDITGTIVDPNGDPIDSVAVSSDGVSDTTGTDGAYTLWNLSVGVHTVQARRTGFYSSYADVEVLAQAEPSVQDFVLSPDMPSPVGLTATPGDEEVHLLWREPGGVSVYDMAYYDDVFEAQIGCGGGCQFGVRFTPPNYPAYLQGLVLSFQGDAAAVSGAVDAYLDPNGDMAGPVGDPINLVPVADLSSPDGLLVQYAFDVSESNLEVSSGDIYIVINEANSGFLGIANDIEPQSPEYYDRNWVSLGAEWATIFDVVAGSPDLTGDFGILASFLGAPGRGSYAMTATGDVVEDPPVRSGVLANYNVSGIVQGSNEQDPDIMTTLDVPYIPQDPSNLNRDDVLEEYHVYQVDVDESETLVATTTDTFATVTASPNYVEYCYHVRAQWNTDSYGVLESRASNVACTVPYASGDADFDSDTDIQDVLVVVDFILEQEYPSDDQFRNCDVNMDEAINIADVIMIIDIIYGGTARTAGFDPSAMAFVDLLIDPNSSELMVNIDYNEPVRGMQFELDYDPALVKLMTPRLSVFQDQVMVTHSDKEPGTIKVIFAELYGGSVEGTGNTFITIPVEFKGEHYDVGHIGLENIQLAGLDGGLVNVVARSTSIDLKLIPGQFALHQNYPNPFNPKTDIRFDLPEAAQVEIAIFNLMGNKVCTLLSDNVTAGYHSLIWDGTNDFGILAATGMYFYTINAGDFRATKKMLFLK